MRSGLIQTSNRLHSFSTLLSYITRHDYKLEHPRGEDLIASANRREKKKQRNNALATQARIRRLYTPYPNLAGQYFSFPGVSQVSQQLASAKEKPEYFLLGRDVVLGQQLRF